MNYLNRIMLTAIVLFVFVIAGCASSPVVVNNERSTSAIRAAEEAGAPNIPNASLYLQLAKEELENAKSIAAKGQKEEAESMLLRSQADGELALALTRGETDKKEAAQATERVRQLKIDNQISPERK